MIYSKSGKRQRLFKSSVSGSRKSSGYNRIRIYNTEFKKEFFPPNLMLSPET